MSIYMYAYQGWTGPGEPHDDGKMNVMTMPFKNMIRNSSLTVWGGAHLLSVKEVPYNIESSRVSGEETFFFFETLMSARGN